MGVHRNICSLKWGRKKFEKPCLWPLFKYLSNQGVTKANFYSAFGLYPWRQAGHSAVLL